MKNAIIIYTDGGARGNPGPAGSGAVVYDGDPSTGSTSSPQAGSGQAKKVAEISEYLGVRTNNFAEYTALILALERCVVLFGPRIERMVEVRMDSELIVKQMKGQYKVKHPVLKDRHAAVCRLIEESFPNISFTHVPREHNKEADKLANDAMDHGEARG